MPEVDVVVLRAEDGHLVGGCGGAVATPAVKWGAGGGRTRW